MIKEARKISLAPIAKLLRLFIRSNLRGSTRLTFLLARHFKSLQQVPIEIPGYSPVYIDLRLGSGHSFLRHSPYLGLWRELDEVNVMRRFVKSGDVAFDIGANIGLHSVLLSQLIGPQGMLFAFEPNPELHVALSRTILELGNATLLNIALSDKEAESPLFIPPDDSMASLADWTVSRNVGESHQATCRQVRLDHLREKDEIPQPDFIKCDVEGAELLVFQGGRKTLDRVDAPLILFETNKYPALGFGLDVSTSKDFLGGLKSARYSFFEVQGGGGLVPINEVNPGYSNLLAVPESKIHLCNRD